jgi:predicted RNase H-like nuclease (RuvC/YqgF family)
VSNLGDDRGPHDDQKALTRLDEAVSQTVSRLEALRTRVEEVQAREADMRGLLGQFTAGELDPAEIMGHVRTLEEENEMLRRRLRDGKEAVERLLARIRFLEEQA